MMPLAATLNLRIHALCIFYVCALQYSDSAVSSQMRKQLVDLTAVTWMPPYFLYANWLLI